MKATQSKAHRLAKLVVGGVNSGAFNLRTFSMTVKRFAFCFGTTQTIAQQTLWILADDQILRLDGESYVMA